MYRSFKFGIYPSIIQLELLFGCSIFIYNYYLSKIKNNCYQNAYFNIYDYVDNLKYEYPFLYD